MRKIGRYFSLFLMGLIGALPVFAQTPAQPPAAATESKAAPITLESFAASPFIEGPELSPSGKHYAAKANVKGEQLLAILPIYDAAEKPTLIKLAQGENTDMDLESWSWVNDDWLLVSISATVQFQGEDIRVRRLASFRRGTGQFVPLAWRVAAQNANRVIWRARDGSPKILMLLQRSIFLGPEFWPEVIEMDVSTGKFKTVQRSREFFSDYWADESGTVRLGYGYDDAQRSEKLIYRPDAKSRFEVLDKANARKGETLTFPNLFLSTPGKAVTISDDDGGFSTLYELDLATMAKGKKIFGVPNYDIDGIIPNAARDEVLGVGATEDRTRIHWVDPKMAKVQKEIDDALGAGRAQIVSWNKDLSSLLVKVGSPDQAGAYYLYDGPTGKMSRFAFADEKLKMRRFSPVTTISYKARDGETIRAVLTLPKGKEAKNLPLIVLPHGGPAARDEETWDWWVQFLAWRGYAVVQPNYRGSTGFGTKFLNLGLGEWGLKMQDDLNDVVAHLHKAGIADAKRVCMAGASYGGYAALRAAQRDGALYRCAISYAGVSDLGDMMRYDTQFLNSGATRDYWKRSAGDLSAVSPLKHPQDFSIPVLIMHGAKDLRVPVRQSKDMANKLKAAGKPMTYIEQPLGDHHFSRSEDRLQFLKEMDAFLAKHNPVN